jgi:hypothetical protein
MDNKSTIALSTKGFQWANQISRKDFRFVSGSKTLVCDRFQAGFISPRIATLVLSDPTIDEFSISNADSRTLEMLEQMICGECVTFDDKNIEIFCALSEILLNSELSVKVVDFVEERNELNVSNCIGLLKHKMRMGIELNWTERLILLGVTFGS